MANETAHESSAVRQRQKLLPDAVLGVVIFIITEAMLFAGLVSAFVIAKAGTPTGLWPPPDQPRLPVEETMINTVALVLSGILLYVVNRKFRHTADGEKDRSTTITMGIVLLLGAFFLIFQGMEWVALIGEGLTMQSSNHGAFFYLIVGVHGLHVLAGLSVLGGLFFRMDAGTLDTDVLWAGSLFWYFVVAMWPILYWQVYL